MNNSLTAIILTYNEEKHIERCLSSLKGLVKRIVIIDSYSTDKTLDLIKKYKADVFQNKFKNQSNQINWALSKIKFDTTWIIRVDADEYLTNNLKSKLNEILKKNTEFDGVSFNRIVKFLNKKIIYGGTSPHKILRMWKNGKGKCEDSWMDEHIKVEGNIFHLNESLIDHNLNNLLWFIKKHKKYAIRESISFFLNKKNKNFKLNKETKLTKKNKYYKFKIYYKLPIFIRPILFFIYSYIFRLGFLSSWQGFIYYIVQILYFRFLVDINIIKLNKLTKYKSFKKVVKEIYGYDKI